MRTYVAVVLSDLRQNVCSTSQDSASMWTKRSIRGKPVSKPRQPVEHDFHQLTSRACHEPKTPHPEVKTMPMLPPLLPSMRKGLQNTIIFDSQDGGYDHHKLFGLRPRHPCVKLLPKRQTVPLPLGELIRRTLRPMKEVEGNLGTRFKRG